MLAAKCTRVPAQAGWAQGPVYSQLAQEYSEVSVFYLSRWSVEACFLPVWVQPYPREAGNIVPDTYG